jgi:ribose-phosphate pyrophosphokinase
MSTGPEQAPLLFAPKHSAALGQSVALALGLALAPSEEREFDGGEHKMRSLVDVRGRDVYVIQSLAGDAQASANDKLCRLLLFIGALHDAGASSITACTPYLCYARKDRRTQSRDPVTTRYVAALFEAVGVDRVVVVDVHDLAAFQNAFRCRTEHLEAKVLFVAHFAPLLAGREVAVVSPDAGGAKRAERFRQGLAWALGRDVPLAFLEKQRSAGVVGGEAVVGEVAGRAVVVLDDLVSTGTTLCRAARACRERGAAAVYAAATHGLFVGGAPELWAEPGLAQVVVTDGVPPFRVDPARAGEKLVVLEIAPLLAAAIERLHGGGSIVELLLSGGHD